jgi:DNA polymerase-3 subunit beta
MKVTILQENLQQALTIISRISTSSGQLPILNTVLIKAQTKGLCFMATNLELSISYWVGAKIEETGEVVLPTRQLVEAVGSLPKEKIIIRREGNQLIISGGGSQLKFNVLEASDFPPIPTLKDQKKSPTTLIFKKQDLVEGVQKVAFAASIDESRAVLTGILLTSKNGWLEMVATDGYRLSLYKLKSEITGEVKKIVLPARAFNELVRIVGEEDETISLALDQQENQAIFSFQNGELVSRLIDGDFPDYEKIIPQSSHPPLYVDKQLLDRAVKLASIFARQSANIVNLGLSKEGITLEATASQMGDGRTKIEAEYQGEPLQIAFNYRFITEALKCLNGSIVGLSFEDNLRPGLFLEKDNEQFLHLIMPVRIQATT